MSSTKGMMRLYSLIERYRTALARIADETTDVSLKAFCNDALGEESEVIAEGKDYTPANAVVRLVEANQARLSRVVVDKAKAWYLNDGDFGTRQALDDAVHGLLKFQEEHDLLDAPSDTETKANDLALADTAIRIAAIKVAGEIYEHFYATLRQHKTELAIRTEIQEAIYKQMASK